MFREPSFSSVLFNDTQNEDLPDWCCHCCTAKNSADFEKCRVCGRAEHYALEGYHLPFHGNNGNIFRPSQILTVVEDIHQADSEGWTALHCACANGNVAAVKELLKLKAKVEAYTTKGQKPLHLAVYSGSLECVKELIKHGADVNQVSKHEQASALHMACEGGYALIAQELITNGADIETLNILRRTPLHCAAMSGRTDVGKLLLRAGAKTQPLDAHNWDPRQVAELFGHRDFQDMMIREQMTEKQAIIKELPVAPWHSELWAEVVKMHSHRRIEHNRALHQRRNDEVHLQQLRQQRTEATIAMRRNERQKELADWKESKDLLRIKEDLAKSRYSIHSLKPKLSLTNG